MSNRMMDRICNFLIKGASLLTILIIVSILGFIFTKGIGQINTQFFLNDYDDKTVYGQFEFVPGQVGVELEKTKEGFKIVDIDKDSIFRNGESKKGDHLKLAEGDYILSVDGNKFEELSSTEMVDQLNGLDGTEKVKIKQKGEGIWPMLVTTLLMVVFTLAIAVPVGIFSAVYLNEYAKQGRLVNIIRFSIECLSGIPSIIYGLFGMLLFVNYLKFNYSLLAGVLTVSIILLPIIIRTTEEALKTVPVAFREGSLALGATKLETIYKLVIPNALPGILTAVVLSVGRIIGESAALVLTAGTVARIPENFFQSASTLTVKAYMVAKEEGNIEMACAIGVVIIVLVFIINLLTRALKNFSSLRGEK